MPPTTYSLADYQAIKTDFKLPHPVLEIIQQLSNKFGVSIISTTATTTTTRPNRKNANRNHQDDTQWQTMRDFKPTVVLDKQNKTNDIRVALNKLSQKNYETTSEFIIEKIRELVEENDDEQIQKTIQTIFDIISTNKIFAPIYARFYKTLMGQFPALFSIQDIPANFLKSIGSLRYADPNTDYDNFCIYNKENDKRKATAIFTTELAAIDAISHQQIFFMTNQLLALVKGFLNETDKKNEIEEITENIYILVTNKSVILNHLPDDIRETILEISQMKSSTYPSITSRAIFKYIDMIEKMGEN
jgi:hypothetical protein